MLQYIGDHMSNGNEVFDVINKNAMLALVLHCTDHLLLIGSSHQQKR